MGSDAELLTEESQALEGQKGGGKGDCSRYFFRVALGCNERDEVPAMLNGFADVPPRPGLEGFARELTPTPPRRPGRAATLTDRARGCAKAS